MTDKEIQIKNSFLYIVPVIVSNLLAIISLSIFTRYLTIQEFGVLALSQIYAIFSVGISNVGLLNIYNRDFFKYRDPHDAAALFYSILTFVFGFSILIGLLTYSFKEFLSSVIIRNAGYENLIFWAYFAAAIQNLKTYYFRYFRNSESAQSFVSYSVADSLFSITLSIIFVVWLKTGLNGLLYGPLVSGAVLIALLTINFIKILPPCLSFNILKKSLIISYPLTPMALFGVIRTQFDKYMIGLINTTGGVGIYSIAQRITNVIFIYMTALQNVFTPEVYKRMFSRDKVVAESIGVYLTPFVWLSIAVSLVVALFSEEMILLLTPEEFHDAVYISVVLSMFYGILFFGKMPQLIYAKKTYLVTLLMLLGLILNIGLNIPFILKWGAIGAAWATFISGLISGAVSFLISQHHYNIKWEYENLAWIYGIFFCAALTVIVMKFYTFSYSWRLILKIVFVLLYGSIGVRLKIISKENLMIILSVISFTKIKKSKAEIKVM